jgi:hypothetical protein
LGEGGATDVPLDSLEFRYTIDESMEYSPMTVESYGGIASVAAVQVGGSTLKRFITDEVVILSDDSTEVDRFIERYDGELLVRENGPAEAEGITTMNVVKVDLEEADLSAFEETATQLLRAGGLGVHDIKVSSEEAARLLSILTNGRLDGLTIYADVLGKPEDIITEYEESSGENAWSWQYLNWEDGPRIGVPQAWSLLQYHRLVPTGGRLARIGVHDSGFCFPDSFSPSDRYQRAASEFPNEYAKFDPVFFYREYVHDDQFIRDESDLDDLDLCEHAQDRAQNRSLYRAYHGTYVSSSALARSDNRYGSVGTVGATWVRYTGDPYYVDHRYARISARRLALSKTAQEEVDIVNMSWGRYMWIVEAWSFGFSPDALYDTFEPLLGYLRSNEDMLLIGSAGNDASDVTRSETSGTVVTTREQYYPCSFSEVLCVGGIDSWDLDSRGRPTRHDSSNYGDEVDISAPFSGNVGWSPEDPGADDLNPAGGRRARFGGTSHSAPFVAGISSMLWSIWSLPEASWSPPGHTGDDFESPTPSRIEKLLFETARPAAYEDSMRHGYVSALSAVGQLLPDKSPEVQLLNGRAHSGECYEGESVSLKFGARGRDVRDYVHSFRPRLQWAVNGERFDVTRRVSGSNRRYKWKNEWYSQHFEWAFSAYDGEPEKSVQASMEDRENQRDASEELEFTVRHGKLEMGIVPSHKKIYVGVRRDSNWPVELHGTAERKTCENPDGITPDVNHFRWIDDNDSEISQADRIELNRAFFQEGSGDEYTPRDVTLSWTGPDDFIRDEITIVPCSQSRDRLTREAELCPAAAERVVEEMEDAMKGILLQERLGKLLDNRGLEPEELGYSGGASTPEEGITGGLIGSSSPLSEYFSQVSAILETDPDDFDRRTNTLLKQAQANNQVDEQGLKILYRTVDVASMARRFFSSQSSGEAAGIA